MERVIEVEVKNHSVVFIYLFFYGSQNDSLFTYSCSCPCIQVLIGQSS